MSILANRLLKIKPSPTLAITAKANRLKAEGKDIMVLAAGEPNFATPENIKEAAIEAIKNNKSYYTPVDGIPELKKAICAKFKRDSNLDYEPAQISVGTGGKQIIYNALMVTLNPGDEVIIPAPYWVSYPDMTLLAEGTPVIVECTEESHFKMKPEQLEKAITLKTKWLILNSPSNPTGSTYSISELKALGEVLKKHPHVYVLSDDIYEKLVYDNMVFGTIAQVVPEIFDRVLTLNGMSKAYAMTGWRIGFAGGPKEIIKAMEMLQSQSTSNPCSIAQYASVAGLNGPQEYLKERADDFKKRRDFVVAELNSIVGIECLTPEGAFYVFPKMKGLIGKKNSEGKVINTCLDFADILLDSAGVAVVPGSAFGLNGFFRISYATSMENLVEAMKRIKKACSELV